MSPKHPNQSIIVTFDFSDLAVSITQPSTWLYRYNDQTKTPIENMLVGVPEIVGLEVRQKVIGGDFNFKYVINCQATDENGNTPIVSGILRVQELIER